jgi:hypothetical protein
MKVKLHLIGFTVRSPELVNAAEQQIVFEKNGRRKKQRPSKY